LYQCDLVEGSGHLRTTVSKGIEIMEGLRGHTSGYAIPTYVVDAPGGGGKIPVMPNYILSQAPGKVVLRNFEGFITTYTEPLDYDPYEIKEQEALIAPRPEPGQEGVLGLLEGKRMFIEPEGFEEVHARGGQEHRLRSGEAAQKWQPLGIGSIEIRPPQLGETTNGDTTADSAPKEKEGESSG
jgi:lysine 2,3-aminomutase